MLKTQNVEKKKLKGQTQAQVLQEEAQVAHGMKQRETVPITTA